MRFRIFKKGFYPITDTAWLLCFPFDEDSGDEISTSRHTFLLARKNPNVILRPGYDPPEIFRRTTNGWVRCDYEIKKKGEEHVCCTSSETFPIEDKRFNEDLDYLHTALLALLPRPFLVSLYRNYVTFIAWTSQTLRTNTSKKKVTQEQEYRWKLFEAVVKSLGIAWHADAGALQKGGGYVGVASGPDGMSLFFRARTENLDPRVEHIYPPLGWLRVSGRLSLRNEESSAGLLSADLSIEVPETLSAEEIANEIIVRLFPVYRDFLSAVAKHSPNEGESPSEVTDEDIPL